MRVKVQRQTLARCQAKIVQQPNSRANILQNLFLFNVNGKRFSPKMKVKIILKIICLTISWGSPCATAGVIGEQLLTVGWGGGAQFKCTKDPGSAIIRPHYWEFRTSWEKGVLPGKEHWNIYPILDSPTGQEKDWTFSTMTNGFYIILRKVTET